MNERRTVVVSGVCCSTEEQVLRKSLDSALGAGKYEFTQATGQLRVDAAVDVPNVVRALRDAGFDGKPLTDIVEDEPWGRRHRAAIELSAAVCIGLIGVAITRVAALTVPGHALLVAAILYGGRDVFRKTWHAVRIRSLDMNVLMTMATAGALAIGRWEEAAAVILLFDLSLMIESYSVRRTRAAVESLVRRTPEEATVIRASGETRIAATDVQPGDRILVRPGERIVVDGAVESGESTVDESALTGESRPREVVPGGTVRAGSINGRGALLLRAACAYADTAYARIARLMEDALHRKSAAQRAVDRFAARYTPAMLALAVLVALVPPLATGAPFDLWLYRALVLLVIACPCAMVIATPVTVVSALTAAARRGVMIKGGETLESLALVRAIALDKTGTITEGRPRVTDVVPLNGRTRADVLSVAARLNRLSEHHIAGAIVAEADRSGNGYATEDAELHFLAHPGFGVSGEIDGVRYRLGSRRFAEEVAPIGPSAASTIDSLTSDGKTVVVLSTDTEHLAVFATRDTPRTHAREHLDALRREKITLVLLSGDDSGSAGRIAAQVGIDRAVAAQLPEQKMEIVRELDRAAGPVAMVGDGVNDAPSLAAASVGIAMGITGTDAALASSDVVLISDDLSRLAGLIRLSRKAMGVIRQNLSLAISLKFIFIVLAVFGVSGLWMAILADDGAALIVILNGLRLLNTSVFDG